jgi:hypothetical protein
MPPRIAQKILRDLKSKISLQSKKNFILEKDVRYLDSRIALLIQNRMALEEVRTPPLSPPRLARIQMRHWSNIGCIAKRSRKPSRGCHRDSARRRVS